jgi:outer membrane protein TolC
MKLKIKVLTSLFVGTLLIGCSNLKYDSQAVVRTETDEKYLEKYGETLSLTEALEIAQEKNFSVRIKDIEREIAKLDKKISFANFLPRVDGLISYNELNKGLYGTVVDSSMPVDLESRIIDKKFYSAGVGVSLPIFVPSSWYLYSARKKGETLSQKLEEYVRIQIQLATLSKYYYILSLEAEKEYLNQEIIAAKEFSKNSSSALKVEAIMPWEYEMTLLAIESKEFALKRNAREIEKARMDFMVTLGLHPLTSFKLEKEQILKERNSSLEEYIYMALTNNPTLKLSDLENEIGKEKIKIAITEFLPKVIFNLGYYENNNTSIENPHLVLGRITGMMSLFNGFKNINEYKKARKNDEINFLKREEAGLKTVMETVNAYNTIVDAKEQRSLSQRNYAIKKNKLHQKRMEEKVSSIDGAEYIKFVAEYEEAVAQKEKAEFQYQIALAAMEIILGNGFLKGEK